MKAPNQVLAAQTDALGGDLRPGQVLPRPFPCPPESPSGPIGGRR